MSSSSDSTSYESASPDFDQPSLLHDLGEMCLRRRYYILVPAVLGLIVAVLYVGRLHYQYNAAALIRINAASSSASLQLANSPLGSGLGDGSPDLETEVTVLQSRVLALRVADVLNLYNNPLFSKPGKGEGTPGRNNMLSVYRIIGAFDGSLAVARRPHTDDIDIGVTTESPELSAQIANVLINEYIARNYQMRYTSQQDVSRWLGDQLDDLRKQTEDAQQRTLVYQKKLGILDSADPTSSRSGSSMGVAQSVGTQRIEALESALTNAETNRVIKEAQFRILASVDPQTISDPTDAALTELRRQRASLTIQIKELSEKYGSSYPPLKELKAGLAQAEASIDTEQTRDRSRLSEEVEASKAAEASLKLAVDKEKEDANQRNDDVVQYTIARREFQSSYELYEGLLGKLKEAGVLAGLHSSNVEIVDPALTPEFPSGPHRTRFLLGGLGAGLVLGLMLAFTIDSLDKSILSGDSLEQITGMPTLGLIPKLVASRRSEGAEPAPAGVDTRILSDQSYPISEAFRSLRTTLFLSRPAPHAQVILITSSVPGEGKSTVSLNLAWALAQVDSRVIVLDCDLRRPTMLQKLGIKKREGITNILTSQMQLEDCVTSVPNHPSLFALGSGPIPPNPAELLSSPAFAALIEELKKSFTYIVLDAPPILSVADPLVLAPLSDGVVFVARSGSTSRQVIHKASRSLHRAGVSILGSVLNYLDFRSNDYGYYNSYYTTPEARGDKKETL